MEELIAVAECIHACRGDAMAPVASALVSRTGEALEFAKKTSYYLTSGGHASIVARSTSKAKIPLRLDQETKEIIKSGAKALENVTAIFNKLARPLAEAVGVMFGDKAHEYRVRNVESKSCHRTKIVMLRSTHGRPKR